MDTIARLFRTSIQWNIFGAIGYQALLLTHQAMLYKCMDPNAYGAMSILLSLVYVGAVIADAGLDATLSAFFKQLSTSRRTFIKTILPHWISVGVIALLLALMFSCTHQVLLPKLLLSPSILLYTFCILLAETYRRNLRMTLQLAFKAKNVALLDTGLMISYFTIVWGSVACGAPLSLDLLLGALALSAALYTLVNIFFVYQFLQKLSDIENDVSPSHKRLIYYRLANGGNMLTHQLFSGNVLVPLVAASSGLAHAGLVKLASHLAHGLVTITRKIVVLSGSALLARLKETKLEIKRAAFGNLSYTLYTIIIMTVIALGSMNSHLVFTGIITPDQSTVLFLVTLLIASEGLCLAYETFFIVEEKVFYAVALNGLTGLAASLLVFNASHLSLISTLMVVLGMRIALFASMAITAFVCCNLFPPLPTIRYRHILFFLTLTSLAYLAGTPLAFLLSR